MTEATSAAKVPGGCLCGDVRFEITLPVRFCAHCHCSMCRRAHGAPWVTWVGVPRAQLRLVSGEDRLVRYASSQAARRSFCGRCGSTLFFEGDRWADEVHVARANIEGDIGLEVQAHCYWDDRADWVPIGDALPRLGGPSGVEPVGSYSIYLSPSPTTCRSSVAPARPERRDCAPGRALKDCLPEPARWPPCPGSAPRFCCFAWRQ